jgi:hypothetical protein
MRYPLLLFAAVTKLAAQDAIPVRPIGRVIAVSNENVGIAPSVRATSTGAVIVGSNSRKRIWAFDSTLKHVTIIRDSSEGTASLGVSSWLIAYLGDSTLVPEADGAGLLLIDPAGRRARVMAPPRANDLYVLGSPRGGRAGLDRQGRIIYRANLYSADSCPLVRGDFDTRSTETIGWLKNDRQNRSIMTSRPDPAGGSPIRTLQLLLNPFMRADEWALLSDGSIAMIRVTDYHIDWIEPDGSHRSTPKMPLDWRRYTDAERQHITDSVMNWAQERARDARAAAGTNNGSENAQGITRTQVAIVPDSEFPSFYAPLQVGSAIPDSDAHVWILPTTSKLAAGGFTYDVIDRSGRIIERVQLPKGRVIVGFGPRDEVYLAHTEDGKTYLERARIH